MEEYKKSKKGLWILLILLFLFILVVGIYIVTRPQTGPFKIKLPGDTLVDTSKPGVYEDDKIKLNYPAGWARYDMVDGKSRGVVLKKAQYTFTVITNFVRASGAGGGRFSEIAQQVMPWLSPNNALSCIEHVSNDERQVVRQIRLHNLYFSPSSADAATKSICGNPTIGGVLWYGSYFSDNGYFIGKPESGEIVVGVSYNATSPDQVPYKGDSNLQYILEEASTMIKEMQIKSPISVQ